MAKAIGMVRSTMDRAMAQHADGQISTQEVSMLESISNRALQNLRARLR